MTSNESLRNRPKDIDPTESPLSRRKGAVIELAYNLGDVLSHGDTRRIQYVPVPDSSSISIRRTKWYSGSGERMKEEQTTVLHRRGWMTDAIGSGDAVFEGNIAQWRAAEVEEITGVSPNHVIAVGAHMDEETLERARSLVPEGAMGNFETDYYVGREGIIKVSLVPIEMDDRAGSFSDIESLGLKRIVTGLSSTDLDVVEGIMRSFISDIQRHTRKSFDELKK